MRFMITLPGLWKVKVKITLILKIIKHLAGEIKRYATLSISFDSLDSASMKNYLRRAWRTKCQ